MMRLSGFIKKITLPFIVGLILILSVVLTTFKLSEAFTLKFKALMAHPMTRDLVFNIQEARSSLSKVVNIIHLPYWFYETTLPVYEITIDDNDLEEMNQYLPKDYLSDYLKSENKIFVNAYFKSNDYNQKVKIRYRGWGMNHWTNAKRSLLVKFDKENLFQKMKSLDLIIPSDRYYLVEMVNNLRLQRAGLMAPNMFFARVRVNNQDAGVYLIKERFSKQWLEKLGMPEDTEVFSQTNDPGPGTSFVTTSDEYQYWRRDINEESHEFNEIKSLFALTQNSSDEVFWKNIGNILDLDKWYKAMAVSVLSGASHSTGGNLNLVFNNANGKLEPLLEDIHINDQLTSEPEEIYEHFLLLTQRILANQDYYEQYRQTLEDLSRPENLEKDLAFYDALYKKMKPEFYKDQSKYQNDFQAVSKMKKAREMIIKNHENAIQLASIKQSPYLNKSFEHKESADLFGSFKYLYDISKSINEFVKTYPQFKIKGQNLVLEQGEYVFNKTLVIPKDTVLIVEPGTKIYLNEKVSLISYSPVRALGTAQNPIIISRANMYKNWGAFAIIDAQEESELSYVTMVGGSSSEKINGVIFTGMLSVHYSHIHLSSCQFYEDMDDDMVNFKNSIGSVIYSMFSNAAGDALDIDATDDFIVKNNTFSKIGTNKETGGDAIDLSFSSNIIISENHIYNVFDKGVSVGEKSYPEINDNLIQGCDIGIAVKDSSEAVIRDNLITNNEQGISLYNKKSIFGGGKAILENNSLKDNKIEINISKESEVIHN